MSDRKTHDASANDAIDHEHVCVHEPERRGRRSFLGAAALTAGTFAAMPWGQVVQASTRALTARAQAEARIAKAGSPPKTRLVLLGTGGGPPPNPFRAGIASALVVGDAVYLVDCGRGAVTQFMKAGLDLAKIRGVFLTHLHLDHIIDFFDFFALGLANPAAGKAGISQPVPVYGPGRTPAAAFRIQPKNPIGGDNPIPGTADLVQKSAEAVAFQLNSIKTLPGGPDVRDLIAVNEIPLPAGFSVTPGGSPPAMQPFPLFENDDVKVRATMVDHPVPSFGFRIDTADGAFAFSGDTGKSDNFIALAKGADLMVHEVQDSEILKKTVDPSFAQLIGRNHTDVFEVGPIAQAAGVKTLVLSHITPADQREVSDQSWRSRAQRGYDGNVVVGRDLMHVTAAGKVVRA